MPSQDTDTILYESIDLISGHRVGPKVVLAETRGRGTPRTPVTPKVIRGKFTNPLGDGQTYTYALYYVATDNVAGGGNGIGVAFSNDGISWKKYPSPVIPATTLNAYGAAQPVPTTRMDSRQSCCSMKTMPLLASRSPLGGRIL